MFKIISVILVLCVAFPSYALEADALKTKIPGDYVLGTESAKITLIEYASLSCPHCADFHTNILPTIQKEYINTGKVRLIYRDFPLNAPALIGAQVTQCVGKYGDKKYYAITKQLLSTQKNWAFDKDFKTKLQDIAQNFGLDEKAFEACINDKEIETKILNSRKDAAEKLGIRSTPSFLVNGEKAEIHSADEARKILNTVLSGKTLEQESKDARKKASIAQSHDMMMGKESAKVTLVEYVNIACPHCGHFHNSLISTLQKDYIETGKVKLVFRELPMSQSSFYAYMLAHCKGKDDFFNMISLLIQEGRGWGGTPAFMPPLRLVAKKAGINKKKFYACLEDRKAEGHIMRNFYEARTLGIKHSPTFYVNGEQIDHPENPEVVRQSIDKILRAMQ